MLFILQIHIFQSHYSRMKPERSIAAIRVIILICLDFNQRACNGRKAFGKVGQTVQAQCFFSLRKASAVCNVSLDTG
jgi:hypothetical protein